MPKTTACAFRGAFLLVATLVGCAHGNTVAGGLSALSTREVQGTAAVHDADLRSCIAQSTGSAAQSFEGTLLLEWTIDPNGGVHGAKIERSTSPAMEECLRKRVTTWSFRPSTSGAIVFYPLRLKANDAGEAARKKLRSSLPKKLVAATIEGHQSDIRDCHQAGSRSIRL